jgi:hypothetical protein
MQNDNYDLEKVNVAVIEFKQTTDQISGKMDEINSRKFDNYGITSKQLDARHDSIMELLQLQKNLSSALFKFCEALHEIDNTDTFETEETKRVFDAHKELKNKLDNSIDSAQKANHMFASQLQNELKLFAAKYDKSQPLLDEDKKSDRRCAFM